MKNRLSVLRESAHLLIELGQRVNGERHFSEAVKKHVHHGVEQGAGILVGVPHVVALHGGAYEDRGHTKGCYCHLQQPALALL